MKVRAGEYVIGRWIVVRTARDCWAIVEQGSDLAVDAGSTFKEAKAMIGRWLAAEQAEQQDRGTAAAAEQQPTAKQAKQAERLAARKVRIEQASQQAEQARTEQAAEQDRQQAERTAAEQASRPIRFVVHYYSHGSSSSRQAASRQQAERWIGRLAAVGVIGTIRIGQAYRPSSQPAKQAKQDRPSSSLLQDRTAEQAEQDRQQIAAAAVRLAARKAEQDKQQAEQAAEQAEQDRQQAERLAAERTAAGRLAYLLASKQTAAAKIEQQAEQAAARQRNGQDRADREYRQAGRQAEQQAAYGSGPYDRVSADAVRPFRHQAYRPIKQPAIMDRAAIVRAVVVTDPTITDRQAVRLAAAGQPNGRTIKAAVIDAPTLRKAGQPTAGQQANGYRPSRPRQAAGYAPATAAMLVSSQTAAAMLQTAKDGRQVAGKIGTATAAAIQESIRSGRIPLPGGSSRAAERYVTVRRIEGQQIRTSDVWSVPYESRQADPTVIPEGRLIGMTGSQQEQQSAEYVIDLLAGDRTAEQAEQAEQAAAERQAYVDSLDSRIGSSPTAVKRRQPAATGHRTGQAR
jgi:hypothetical protein